jgi:Glycoside Hydrolase Family 113
MHNHLGSIAFRDWMQLTFKYDRGVLEKEPQMKNITRKRMIIGYVILLTVVISGSLVLGIKKTSATAPIEKQKGMSYAAWWPGLYSTPEADQALAELSDDGADWISLIVTRYQTAITSTIIYTTTGTPTDEDLIHVISQAHSLGMKVMLKPHLDLANDPYHWRGEIGIGFSESDWAAWFSAYKSFINYYAQLAQSNGADQFCIGTELASTEFQAADWKSVIAGVRGIFTGPITYAANHDSEGAISWWDKVDFIGVDAYYPLTGEVDPTMDEIIAAWAPRVASLQALSEYWEKPIIFTEIGYRSQDGANMHPWDYQSGGMVDLQEQADLYQATLESFFNQSWFAGMFWWSWETDPFQGGPCDMNYTPHDKPAEEILRMWYGAPPQSNHEEIPGLDYTHSTVIYSDTLGSGWDDWSWGGDYVFTFSGTVASGAYAISANALPWGAVALHYNNIESSPYYWLELYVYKTTGNSSVVVWANDENDSQLRGRPVEYCRYTGGQPIQSGVWTRVRIPLKDLNASNSLLQRVSIGNASDQPFTFYVDDIRLVAARWKRYLPVVLRP